MRRLRALHINSQPLGGGAPPRASFPRCPSCAAAARRRASPSLRPPIVGGTPIRYASTQAARPKTALFFPGMPTNEKQKENRPERPEKQKTHPLARSLPHHGHGHNPRD